MFLLFINNTNVYYVFNCLGTIKDDAYIINVNASKHKLNILGKLSFKRFFISIIFEFSVLDLSSYGREGIVF